MLRITLIARCLTLTIAVPAIATETTTYTYDALGRIAASASAGSVNNGVTTNYYYDNSDNRTVLTVAGAATGASSFAIAGASAAPGGALVFNVTKSNSTTIASTVNFTTANGSAVSGTDYTATSGTLSFTPAETLKQVTVQSVASSRGNNSFAVQLSGATGGATISSASATGTITAANSASFAVGNASAAPGGTLAFTVTKTGTTSVATSVNFATVDGSAVNGTDYSGVTGTLSFNPADTSMQINVASIASSAGNKSFSVQLSAPAGGATVGTASGTGTITAATLAEVTATNPSYPNLSSNQTVALSLATLANTNGHKATIASISPASGNGSATIAADGQSATYTAPPVAKAPSCEPGKMVSFAVPYSISDSDNGVVVNGSISVTVTGPPGGNPPPGTVCQSPSPGGN